MLRLSSFILALLFVGTMTCQADEKFIRTFNPGSLQQILREHSATPLVLTIWSSDCSSCLRDMDVLYNIHLKHPELKIVMLSTDGPSATNEVKGILARHRLGDLDNWIFGAGDAQKLRYEIDPSWHGELPRTYFYSAAHTRVGKSGALRSDEIEAQITNITH